MRRKMSANAIQRAKESECVDFSRVMTWDDCKYISELLRILEEVSLEIIKFDGFIEGELKINLFNHHIGTIKQITSENIGDWAFVQRACKCEDQLAKRREFLGND